MPPVSEGIFDREHRALTIGSILAMSTVAFEGLALVTVAPLVARDLGGEALYGWIFSAFLLTQIVSTVLAGQQIDRRGPATPFAVSLVLFGAGLVVGSLAQSMPVLIAGRALQGLGAGAVATCVYAVVNRNYVDALRPRMMATISTAWIVPSLVGPAIAGIIAEAFTWRVVFAGIVPLLLISGVLATPAFRGDPGAAAAARTGDRRLGQAIALAIGAGAFLAGLATTPVVLGATLAIAGLAVAVPAMRSLLPPGTLTARPGLPAVIATRAMFVSAFFTGDAFLILALTDVGGYRASVAGLVISAASLAWTSGSWLQVRIDRRSGAGSRRDRVRWGVVLVATGVTALTVITAVTGSPPIALAIVAWVVAGLGIGLAHSTISTMAFAHATGGEEGTVSSSLLLADLGTPALTIGIGGALVALAGARGWAPETGVLLAFLVSVTAAALAGFAASRMPRGAPA